MSTRSSRKSHSTSDTPPILTNLESLILAQAVWEHGANAWLAVAKILTKHPLISRPKSFFTAQTCHNIYDHLMKEAGLECTEANNSTRASGNLKLAEKYYNTRFVELRGLILAEEVKFKTILSEIDDIRSGRWDDEIKAKVTGIPIRSVEPKVEVTASLSEAIQEEVYEGSDLSGVTDTPPSQSQDDKDDILVSKPTPPPIEETLDVEGIVVVEGPSQPVQPIPTRETSVNMLGAPSPIAIEVPSSDEEDHVVPLPANGVPSEVPASPSEAPVESPIIVDDVASPSPTTEQMPEEQDEVGENLPGEAHRRMEYEFANTHESIQQQQQEEKKEEEEEEEEEDQEEEEEEEEEEEDVKGGEGEGEEDKDEDTQAGGSDHVPLPVTDVFEPTLSIQIGTSPDMTSGSGEQAPATPAVAEPETEPEEVNEHETMSSGEEPLQVIRRSTRRRRSSASSIQPLQTRGRKNRRHKRVSTEAPDTPPVILDVEGEQTPGTDKEVTMDSPKDEDQDLSPEASEVAFTRREGKRKASFVEGIGSPRERKRARDDSEPAEEDEPGPSSSISRGRRRTDRTEEQKRFQNVITMLHSTISQHRNGNIFHHPIKPSEAPDYHEIVKRPIDLKSIKMKVKDGAIASSLEFQRDIYLMFANAMIYNRPGSDVYTMAEDMMLESEAHILAFRQTEGFVRGTHRI